MRENVLITVHPGNLMGGGSFHLLVILFDKCYHIWRKSINNLWFEKLMKIWKNNVPFGLRILRVPSLQYTAAAFTLYTAVNKWKCCVFTGILQASHEDEAKRLVETINDKISWRGRPWLWRCCQVNSGSSVSSCTQPCQASLCSESWTSPVSALLLSHYSYFCFFL